MKLDDDKEAVNIINNAVGSLHNKARAIFNRGYMCGYEDGKREAIQMLERTLMDMTAEQTEPQKIGYCNECKWFRDKQVCGRCRSKNMYAPKDEPNSSEIPNNCEAVAKWVQTEREGER